MNARAQGQAESGEPALRLATAIGGLVGRDRIRAPSGRELLAAEMIVEPESAAELSAIVAKCEADKITLAPLGSARTLAELRAGRPVSLGVSLARMARVVAYEPADMTIVAETGLTLGALNEHMAPYRQHLPLDPPGPAMVALGALIGAAKAGPLRLSEGTPRDLLIGVKFAGHGGRLVHGGGRVVKNVAGYDLMKVMTGSFGTLGIVTEATFKVRPLPEHFTLVRLVCGSLTAAFETALRIHDAIPLLHLEVLSPAAAAAPDAGRPSNFTVVAGVCGSRSEVDYQLKRIAESANRGDREILELASALKAYRRLRDFEFPAPAIAAQIAVPPAQMPQCLEACGAEFRAHAGSGVAGIFSVGEPAAEAARLLVERWRGIARGAGGHLRVLSLPAGLRGSIDLFGAPGASVFRLMARLKRTFDPAGIFNPGCFVGGL